MTVKDLEELFALSDRLAVLVQGTISQEFTPPQYDAMRVGSSGRPASRA